MSALLSEDHAVYVEDALISDVQFAIHNLLEVKKMSRADLARKLGVSEARISQLFSDTPRNLTLKTIARVFHALNERPRVTCDTLDLIIERANNIDLCEASDIDQDGLLIEMVESSSTTWKWEPRNDNEIAYAA